MQEIQVFENNDFGNLSVIYENGKAYFPSTECAKILEYSNPHDAVSRHCRSLVKREVPHPQNPSKTIEANFITEGDLYRLITHSKLPTAERFERWVFDEVLPSIRKHGAYATEDTIDKILQDPDFGIRLLGELKAEREQRKALESQAVADAPKVLFAKSVECSEDDILIGQLAKILKQNGRDIGQNRLFDLLRRDGYLIARKGSDYNLPTQKSMELGLMRIKETCITHSDGRISTKPTTKITGKGQVYFVNRYAPKPA